MKVFRPALLATAVAVALTATVFPGVASAAPAGGEKNYIVTLKNNAVANGGQGGVERVAKGLAAKRHGKLRHVYSHALRGFAVTLKPSEATRLAADASVARVELDGVAQASGTQTNAVWGLDRIDQRALPLNRTYNYPNGASVVTAYVLDTGIRVTHSEFAGRAVSGYDFIDRDSNANDCHGHGTHVAGTIGGRTYGVAQEVRLVAVRVLGCNSSGSYSGIIAGIDWVTRHHRQHGGPAVANMSLGGSNSTSLNNAVRNSIASGVFYAVAGGNSNRSACNYSPASTPEAVTVGATTSSDARASYSNYGPCLDIFAPGSSVKSAGHGSNSATKTMSGTSMASPHVAGAAAIVLQAHPDWSPAQVREELVTDATSGVVSNAGRGSLNKLLYVG